MRTATLEIAENTFVGAKPHEATFTLLTLDDGSTAPLGDIKRVAIQNREAALEWASANNIRIAERSVCHDCGAVHAPGQNTLCAS